MDFGVIFAKYPDGATEPSFYANSSEAYEWLEKHDGTENFIKHYPYVALPYLITIVLGTVCGTIGNILIICSVLTNKVSRVDVI